MRRYKVEYNNICGANNGKINFFLEYIALLGLWLATLFPVGFASLLMSLSSLIFIGSTLKKLI